MKLEYDNPYTDITEETSVEKEVARLVIPYDPHGAVEDLGYCMDALIAMQARLIECLVENGTLGKASLNYVFERAEYNGVLRVPE